MKRQQTTAMRTQRREAAPAVRGVGADTVGCYRVSRPSFAVLAMYCSTENAN
jgi:hypothetical protein